MTTVSRKKPVPRAQRKLDTRERVRAAAFELFSEKGYDETTTKEIAAKAGVAAGTVFLHASDKADLLCLVMHELLAGVVEERLASLPKDAPLLEQLLHVFRGPFEMYGKHPKLARPFLLVVGASQGPNAQASTQLTFAFIQALAQLVEAAQARGEAKLDVEPLAAAQNFFALYFFALFGWTGGFYDLESALDPILRGALALQLHGILAP